MSALNIEQVLLITKNALRSLIDFDLEIKSYDREDGVVYVTVTSRRFETVPSKIDRFEWLSALTVGHPQACKLTYIFEAWTPDEYKTIYGNNQGYL